MEKSVLASAGSDGEREQAREGKRARISFGAGAGGVSARVSRLVCTTAFPVSSGALGPSFQPCAG